MTMCRSKPLPTEFASEIRYLIYGPYHTGGELAVWWGPDRCGYTSDIARAGLYTMAEAAEALFMDGPLPVGTPATRRGETLVDPDALVSVRRTIVLVSKADVEALLNGK